MTADIRGLEQWEGEATAWAKRAGDLKTRAGIGMVDALESWYKAWLKKPTDRNKRECLTWRLRLHLRWNNEPEFLEELNETFDLGLFNEEVGPTYWNIAPEQSTGFTSGFNWRRDSGDAIRGRVARSKRTESEESVEE